MNKALAQPLLSADPTLRRFVSIVFVVGGLASLLLGIYDRHKLIATEWDALWNPVTSTIYIMSGAIIYRWPQQIIPATVAAFFVTSVYQLGIHFYALYFPSPITYYALASSSSFDPLAYIALFITIPHLAVLLGSLHCAALYILYFGCTTLWPLSPEGIAAEHLVIAALLSHPAYIVALRYIVKLQNQLAETQIATFRKKSEFLAMLSHEIRNLLQSLVSTIDLLHFKAKDQKSQLAIERMHKTTEQLQSCLRDADELTKLDNPNLNIEISTFNLVELLAEIGESQATKATEKKITLTIKSPLKELQLSTDRERLRQIIENLLSNSLKYTQYNGRITISFELTTAPSPCVEIKIADTGVGIPKEHLGRIFLPYVRLSHQLTEREPGSGLGLAIVKKILGALGGEISVNSKVGEGSTFAITIPRNLSP